MTKRRKHGEQILLNELQLLLAEKRTYLSLLRTGLTVFLIPLTIISFLVATINYHNFFQDFLTGLIVVSTLSVVSLLGLYIFIRSEINLRRINKLIREVKESNKHVAELVV